MDMRFDLWILFLGAVSITALLMLHLLASVKISFLLAFHQISTEQARGQLETNNRALNTICGLIFVGCLVVWAYVNFYFN